MNLTTILSRLDPRDIRPLDKQFSQFLKTLDSSNQAIEVAGFLVSYELGKGNVCLNLSAKDSLITADEGLALKAQLMNCKLVHVIGSQSADTQLQKCPLVLSGNGLYLQRYYHYEQDLANGIQTRLQTMPWQLEDNKTLIQTLFSINPDKSQQEINWQAVAACISAQSKFSVISGGPGTGKTTTVIRLLALIIQQYQNTYTRNPIIKLAAPTGKAAMRLTQSITDAKAQLDVVDTVKQAIPQKAETLHRLLQRDRQGAFKFNQFNPLHLDVLIVDEASMVDLPLMAKLIQAMPEHGQIILLGDKDQLASVEAGSVLADICDNEKEHGYSLDVVERLGAIIPGNFEGFIEAASDSQVAKISNHICHLRKSYRFNQDSGIGHLAKAANEGDYSLWQKVMQQSKQQSNQQSPEPSKEHSQAHSQGSSQENSYYDVEFYSLDDESYQTFMGAACDEFIGQIKLIDLAGMDDESALALHEEYARFQILCALKEGPLGVSGINEVIEKGLRKAGFITDESQWYSGRPIIVLENDYGLNLYNGDVGILLPHKNEQGDVRLKATFVGVDQKIRWIQPSRLPKHDTVYAMTVHKSQGSEFEHCALVLPNYSVPVLTKELIYTGITRAKKKLTILAHEHVLKASLKKKVKRASGLGQILWASLELSKKDPPVKDVFTGAVELPVIDVKKESIKNKESKAASIDKNDASQISLF